MVSKKRRLNDQLLKINQDFFDLNGLILRNVIPRPKIRKEYSEFFLEKLEPLKEKYLAHNQKIQNANMSNKDYYKDRVGINIVTAINVIDSLTAFVKLKEVNHYDHQERFELTLQLSGMNLSDLENVVKEHKDLVNEYFEMETLDLPSIGVNTSDRILYDDMARRYKSELDEIASKIFRKNIHTKLDVNVNEKNPHQHLGWINIGFEHRLPALIALVAHEGPFGHQTQHNFSEDYLFNNYACSQTSEGLAILGQQIALNKYFGSDEIASQITDFEIVTRRIRDSFNAAHAYLGFYKKLSVEEMANELATDFFPENILVNMLQHYNSDQLRSFNNDRMVAYHVGFNQVKEIYDHSLIRLKESTSLKSEGEKENFYSSLLRTMYTGHRTPAAMNMEVDLLFRQNKS